MKLFSNKILNLTKGHSKYILMDFSLHLSKRVRATTSQLGWYSVKSPLQGCGIFPKSMTSLPTCHALRLHISHASAPNCATNQISNEWRTSTKPLSPNTRFQAFQVPPPMPPHAPRASNPGPQLISQSLTMNNVPAAKIVRPGTRPVYKGLESG